jgi:hypothetical protein
MPSNVYELSDLLGSLRCLGINSAAWARISSSWEGMPTPGAEDACIRPGLDRASASLSASRITNEKLWSIIGYSAAALVIVLSAPVRSEDVKNDAEIAEAVSMSTTLVDGEPRHSEPHLRQQIELSGALTALPRIRDAVATKSRGTRRYYNCPPPVGSVTASPQVICVPAGALGSATIHWRWDQSSARAVGQHSCLWVSGGEESEAHLVQCEGPAIRMRRQWAGWVRVAMSFVSSPGILRVPTRSLSRDSSSWRRPSWSAYPCRSRPIGDGCSR